MYFVGSRVAEASGPRSVEIWQLDPKARRELLSELATRAGNIFDVHPDSQVGRVLQSGLEDVDFAGVALCTNRFGMREREYEVPKPAGLVRIVLLGDSFVFGSGVSADARMGVQLERMLQENGRTDRVECLHIGVPGWNLVNECAYLRRQLAWLEPDLVVQFSVRNDLNDSGGVRGTGTIWNVVPHHRTRADAPIGNTSSIHALGIRTFNFFAHGLDWESRSRFWEAGQAVRTLAQAVEASGGKYLFVLNWGFLQPVAFEHLASGLKPDQQVVLPASFATDPKMVLADDDRHWNAMGHRTIALLLASIMIERALLPELFLEAWPAVRAHSIASLHRRGLAQATGASKREIQLTLHPEPRRRVDCTKLDEQLAAQTNGGLDAKAAVGVYASFLLAGGGVRELVVGGQQLGHRVLGGATVSVFVEEALIGELPLEADGPIRARFPIPIEIGDRPYLCVRFESNDFAYEDLVAGSCRTFRLESLEVR